MKGGELAARAALASSAALPLASLGLFLWLSFDDAVAGVVHRVSEVHNACVLVLRTGVLQWGYAAAWGALLALALTLIVLQGASLAQTAMRTRRSLAPLNAMPAEALPEKVEAACGLAGAPFSVIHLVDAEHPAAFTFGYLRPRICVTRGLGAVLDVPQLAAVIAHEDWHRRHRDPLRLLLVSGCRPVRLLLPVVPWLIAGYRFDRELAADRAAARLVGTAPVCAALERLRGSSTSLGTGIAAAGISPDELRLRVLAGEQHAHELHLDVAVTSVLRLTAAGGLLALFATVAEPGHAMFRCL